MEFIFELIYQAALEEFGTHAYDAVHMEQICQRHHISKGMLYHYYSGKDELFLLCADRTFRDFKSYIEEEIRTLRAPLRDLNHEFLKEQLSRMPLREGIRPEEALRYLECIEQQFKKLLGMILFGITDSEALSC